MVVGWSLISATLLLVIVGAVLYDAGLAGWAQMLWVFASGTAGAGVMKLIDSHAAERQYWDEHGFWG